ncbi:hypothetical protein BJ170DRAFT_591319 [Xylariales sp. AK1849]|nr:hypothetical protein BJ170DRAFT_591319 [Xylariales sp. AK1849]
MAMVWENLAGAVSPEKQNFEAACSLLKNTETLILRGCSSVLFRCKMRIVNCIEQQFQTMQRGLSSIKKAPTIVSKSLINNQIQYQNELSSIVASISTPTKNDSNTDKVIREMTKGSVTKALHGFLAIGPSAQGSALDCFREYGMKPRLKPTRLVGGLKTPIFPYKELDSWDWWNGAVLLQALGYTVDLVIAFWLIVNHWFPNLMRVRDDFEA